jgi:hypothetical protein
MSLIAELNFTEAVTSYSYPSFTHQILANNSINYYMNDDRGISIYDQDWNFIRRINLNSLNQDITLRGNMFIHEEFIYIANVVYYNYYDYSLFLKLDFDLNIINYKHFLSWQSISIAFDSCNTRIIFLWTIYNSDKIFIDIYDLNLRKVSEMDTTTINNKHNNMSQYSTAIVLFNNHLYISYKDQYFYQYIIVSDINGQYITTYSLIQTSISYFMNYFTLDYFGNILYTSMGKLCLFETSLNKTSNCIENLGFNEYKKERGINSSYYDVNDYPLYAQLDQSGRLVAIDSFKKKIKLYY